MTVTFDYYEAFLAEYNGRVPSRKILHPYPRNRAALVKKYAWSVLTPLGFSEVAKYSPLLSLGSGDGYNEHVLQQLGADVLATDIDGVPLHGPWGEVLGLDAEDATAIHHKRNIFLSWPHYTADWDAAALEASQCEYVIYVGEGPGGCCGSPALHTVLWEKFEEIDPPSDENLLVRWPGLNDYMAIYKRR